jgi:hypothetical protein
VGVDKCGIEWATGLFEGEGCIGITRGQNESSSQVKLSLATSDFDVLARFREVAGFGNIRDFKTEGRPMRIWDSGKRDEIEGFLTRMLPYLGERRKSRALEALAFISEKRERFVASHRARGLKRRKPCGHPRPVVGCCGVESCCAL